MSLSHVNIKAAVPWAYANNLTDAVGRLLIRLSDLLYQGPIKMTVIQYMTAFYKLAKMVMY